MEVFEYAQLAKSHPMTYLTASGYRLRLPGLVVIDWSSLAACSLLTMVKLFALSHDRCCICGSIPWFV